MNFRAHCLTKNFQFIFSLKTWHPINFLTVLWKNKARRRHLNCWVAVKVQLMKKVNSEIEFSAKNELIKVLPQVLVSWRCHNCSTSYSVHKFLIPACWGLLYKLIVNIINEFSRNNNVLKYGLGNISDEFGALNGLLDWKLNVSQANLINAH